MAGWFELSKSSDDQYRFVLKAGNGEIILTSELYTTKGAAEKGIASVQANSPLDERYEKKTASNGKLHFNLKAANHQILVAVNCMRMNSHARPVLLQLRPMVSVRR